MSSPPPSKRRRSDRQASRHEQEHQHQHQQQQQQQQQKAEEYLPDPLSLPPSPPPPPPPPDDDSAPAAPPPPTEPPPPPPPPDAPVPATASAATPPVTGAGAGLVPPNTSRPPEEGQEELEEIEDAEYWSRKAAEAEAVRRAAVRKPSTLYLDTISRPRLDFDFEHVCSVSMSPSHVYACLVCGKFFQGRGPSSWATKHAVDEDHRVFLKLASDGGGESGSLWILPEGDKLVDPTIVAALSDIRYLLNPTYTERQLRRLDAPNLPPSRDLNGRTYYPGFVGLNNVGQTDFMNVVIQALVHVKPLRDFFIRGGAQPAGAALGVQDPMERDQMRGSEPIYRGLQGGDGKISPLVSQFSLLVRKLWNPRLFKPQVSPQEFLHAVDTASKGKFRLNTGGDPSEFLSWLLNQLHTDLGGSRKKQSIISACFRGALRVESQKVFVRSGLELEDEPLNQLDADGRADGGQRDEKNKARFNIDQEVQVNFSPFFFLTIDLPPLPVFRDQVESNIIPQVPLAQLIAKYDGVTFQETRGWIRRFKLTRLPPFLILHYRRFTTNNFVEERNRTIVNFPVRGLDMSPTIDASHQPGVSLAYDLVANITHDATPGTVKENQVWRAQLHTRVDGEPIPTRPSTLKKTRMGPLSGAKQSTRVQGTAAEPDAESEDEDDDDDDDDNVEEQKQEQGQNQGQRRKQRTPEERWFQIQDLIVEDIDRQMLFLGESYVQIWKRKDGEEEVGELMRQQAEAKTRKHKSHPMSSQDKDKSRPSRSN